MTNALERRVRIVAKCLHENQIARLHKIPNDMKILGDKAVHGEQTPADFIGWTASGRVIVIECKMCEAPSLGINSSGLKPHQLIALREANDSGGLGLLVWQRESQIAVIDADQVKLYSQCRKSIPWRFIPADFKHGLDVEHLRFFWPFMGSTCHAVPAATSPLG